MERIAGIAVSRSSRFLVVASAMLLGGCTMCPDPYDYSGPVPNGSSPQNDFRARSNGILPIGAAPVPWPLIVRHDSTSPEGGTRIRRRGTPTPADQPVLAASAESPVEAREPMSVLVAGGSESAEAAGSGETAPPDPWQVLPDFGEVDASPCQPEHDEGASAETAEPSIVPTAAAAITPLAETPGWRPRGSR
jgi:hypothetical protein